MAEWLGNGLQNRVQQFESAWYLKEKEHENAPFFFYQLKPTEGLESCAKT